MCRAVVCRTCRKTTWAGCGMHVSQVLAGVPASDRCEGHPRGEGSDGGWLGRLFGR